VTTILDKVALSLASRFREGQQGISDFIEHVRQIPPIDAASHLSSSDVADLLGRLDSVGLRLLAELLDEVRIQGEEKRLFSEAAYWDLIADRVRDELLSRRP
jgi:ABC-type transporter Mla MlaB component